MELVTGRVPVVPVSNGSSGGMYRTYNARAGSAPDIARVQNELIRLQVKQCMHVGSEIGKYPIQHVGPSTPAVPITARITQ